MLDLKAAFERLSDTDEYGKFDRIPAPAFRRPDLCAFVLLETLAPGSADRRQDLVSAAEHDRIWLSTDVQALAGAATEEHVLTLVRCGVRYDGEFDCLTLAV